MWPYVNYYEEYIIVNPLWIWYSAVPVIEVLCVISDMGCECLLKQGNFRHSIFKSVYKFQNLEIFMNVVSAKLAEI